MEHIEVKSRLDSVDVRALRSVFGRFGGLLRANRGRLVLSGFSAVGVAIMTLARPWPLKVALDYILIPGSAHKDSWLSFLADWNTTTVLVLCAAAILLIAAVRGLLTYTREVQSKAAGHQLVADIRLRLFTHIQRLPQSYHDYRETGELMTRLTGDMELVKELLVSTFITLGSQILIIIGMLTLMFWIDWQLALVGVAIAPLFLFAAFRFSGKIQRSARKQRERYGSMVASVQESLAGISQTKGFGREKEREKVVGRSLGRDAKANLRTTKLSASYTRIVELITALGSAVALFIGVMRALDGAITPGDLIVFLSYLRGVYRPVQGIARLTTKIAKATTRAEKILEIFDMEPEVRDSDDAKSARGTRGEFAFNAVSFSYVNRKQALNDFSCHIPAGKTTLIVGPNGAGKSTVAKLILRLYQPDKGKILLDSASIDEFKVQSLRKRITPLTQETFLFRTSIYDNIAFSKSRPTREEVIAAAKRVGADSFIRQLPEGYDTLVGEGGVTLSGGQRQLLSFARAALRDTPILILDEPASGLDIHVERDILSALKRLKADRTFIIITHRLTYLELADHVVFIRDGVAVEEGSVSELRERDGQFAQYVSQDTASRDTVSQNTGSQDTDPQDTGSPDTETGVVSGADSLLAE